MMAAATEALGRVLVVDDSVLNRRLLQRALGTEGYDAMLAEDGEQALNVLRSSVPPPFDIVLLDILMPNLDGYETLTTIKTDPALRHLPVIMITAVDETESAVRCIELGATDYLPKPFNVAVLRARIGASLAAKRLRDLELEYLEQVGRVTEAATAVEAGTFAIAGLDSVAARTDALGSLARVFQRMATEVRAREERLQQKVRELQIVIDEERQAKKVAEITESDYFQRLRRQAADLRRIME
ncbi:MAG TPA: response regulator [Thermomicrobiales bacterium]|nr:response regulator [Thermomicrobiales bacterium]